MGLTCSSHGRDDADHTDIRIWAGLGQVSRSREHCNEVSYCIRLVILD
jgi:hypothetical protein